MRSPIPEERRMGTDAARDKRAVAGKNRRLALVLGLLAASIYFGYILLYAMG